MSMLECELTVIAAEMIFIHEASIAMHCRFETY